jgi:hypothetical protein
MDERGREAASNRLGCGQVGQVQDVFDGRVAKRYKGRVDDSIKRLIERLPSRG